MKSNKESFIGIRVEEELKKELEKLAAKEDRSLTNLIRNILKKFIKKGGKL